MAAVLFIITIPTADEEKRLKSEFLAKKLNQLIDDDQNDAETPTMTTSTTIKTSKTTLPSTKSAGSMRTVTDTKQSDAQSDRPSSSASSMHEGQPFIKRYDEFDASNKTSIASMTINSAKKNTDMNNVCKESTDAESLKLGSIGDNMDGGAFIMRRSWDGLRDMISSSSSAKRKDAERQKNLPLDLNIPNDTCMELVLREILKKFDITNAVWTKNSQGRIYQIIFTIELNAVYEKVLEKFQEWGIGDRECSTVSVMNCVVAKSSTQKDDVAFSNELQNQENIIAEKQSAWERFMNSVRSRLNVAQIIRDVRMDATITFDFTVLLISAAILASIGLIDDSVVYLASSMLISPLMGPIIASVFGTVIKDHSLRSLGLRNELFGILLATLVGFIFGLVVGTTYERYSNGHGVTNEMMSRCNLHALLIGIVTAIPTGAAGAIAILGGNIGSLVGVAISASILPPAVNAGVLWALACIYKVFETDTSQYNTVVSTHVYSHDQGVELMVMGAMSMCITITNVLCVYIMGIIVLRVKEVAPIILRKHNEFWKHDIKIARDFNKQGFHADADDAAIFDELNNLPKEDKRVLGFDCDVFRNIHLDDSIYQNTWSPIGDRNFRDSRAFQMHNNNYLTVQHLITKPLEGRDETRHRLTFGHVPNGRLSDIGGTTYKILTENIPRRATMPCKPHPRPLITITNSISSASSACTSDVITPTLIANERQKRKFIVTPAEDPLHRNNNNYHTQSNA